MIILYCCPVSITQFHDCYRPPNREHPKTLLTLMCTLATNVEVICKHCCRILEKTGILIPGFHLLKRAVRVHREECDREKLDLEVLIDLHVLSHPEYEIIVIGMQSVSMSVCPCHRRSAPDESESFGPKNAKWRSSLNWLQRFWLNSSNLYTPSL
jgi:hypothetical protein